MGNIARGCPRGPRIVICISNHSHGSLLQQTQAVTSATGTQAKSPILVASPFVGRTRRSDDQRKGHCHSPRLTCAAKAQKTSRLDPGLAVLGRIPIARDFFRSAEKQEQVLGSVGPLKCTKRMCSATSRNACAGFNKHTAQSH